MRIDGKENEKKTSGQKTRNRLKESRTKHKLFIFYNKQGWTIKSKG